MKISTKVLGQSLAAVAVTAGIFGGLVFELSKLSDRYSQLMKGPIVKVEAAERLQRDYRTEWLMWKNIIARHHEAQEFQAKIKQLRGMQQTVQKELDTMRAGVRNPATAAALDALIRDNRELNRLTEKAGGGVLAQESEAKALDAALLERDTTLTKQLDALVSTMAQHAMEDAVQISAEAAAERRLTTVVGVVILLAFLGFDIFFFLHISKRLARLKEVSDLLSSGDIEGVSRVEERAERNADEVQLAIVELRSLAQYLQEIDHGLGLLATGDLSGRVQPRSDNDVLAKSYQRTVGAIAAMTDDVKRLSDAGVAGELSVRADAARHEGEYGKIIAGVNATLDAIVKPLSGAVEYVKRIGRGDIPEKLTTETRGEYRVLRDSMNACIDGLAGLTEANRALQRMAVNDLSVKVEGEYQGVFAEVSEAVRLVQQRLQNVHEIFHALALGDFQEMLASLEKVGRHSEQDQLLPSAIATMRAIEALVNDTRTLAVAATEGRMGLRADANKHQGEYREVVEGVNHLLETMVEPLQNSKREAPLLAATTEKLAAAGRQMSADAEATAEQANVVSAASEQISKNVASVATASEEMQASIGEISKSANEAARVAGEAVHLATTTNETVKKLGDSSQEIGDVIKVIASIAQQTNLLALNATIEAARAGEAGKGFAVVANEVKELAKQTAKATEEIGQKIDSIQGVSTGAATAIEEIGTVIHQINDLSNSIASAVEEQTVTTNEIGRSVAEAASGVTEIARNIGHVATSAKGTTDGAKQTNHAAIELNEMADRLSASVAKFTF